MIRTRSRSRGRSDSNPGNDPIVGITRRGTRYSVGSHDSRSPAKHARRHSVGRMEYGTWTSVLEDANRRQKPPQHLFFEDLIVNVSEHFDIIGRKIQTTVGAILEFILNCLVNIILQVRMTFWPNSSPYDRSAARIDVLSFLWVGFWSLVVTLFFVSPDPKLNVVKRAARFVVGTFQVTGLLYFLFFMLYLYKMFN